jgi:hypothetical protein
MRPAIQRPLLPSTQAALPANVHLLAKHLSRGLQEHEHFNFWSDIHTLSRGRDQAESDNALLALLLGDALFGLVNATRIAGLQEITQGLAHLYAARAQGRPAARGLENLLPVLLMEAGAELRERNASRQEHLVLKTLRLAWSCNALGPRGLRATASACRRAIGAGRALAAGQRALLLQALTGGVA